MMFLMVSWKPLCAAAGAAANATSSARPTSLVACIRLTSLKWNFCGDDGLAAAEHGRPLAETVGEDHHDGHHEERGHRGVEVIVEHHAVRVAHRLGRGRQRS